MIMDAVRQLGDAQTHRKLDALRAIIDFYKKHESELSSKGERFNQAVKRLNELAIAQELTPSYFEHIICPLLEDLHLFLLAMREEQHKIAKTFNSLFLLMDYYSTHYLCYISHPAAIVSNVTTSYIDG